MSSSNKVDLKINLFVFFQFSLISPFGGGKYPSSTNFLSISFFTVLLTRSLLTRSVSEIKLSCEIPNEFKSFLINSIDSIRDFSLRKLKILS